MNVDRKRKNECIAADCRFAKDRCLVFYGKDCIRNGGTKIPVQSIATSQRIPLKVEVQTTFNAYWIVDEWAETEGR